MGGCCFTACPFEQGSVGWVAPLQQSLQAMACIVYGWMCFAVYAHNNCMFVFWCRDAFLGTSHCCTTRLQRLVKPACVHACTWSPECVLLHTWDLSAGVLNVKGQELSGPPVTRLRKDCGL